MVRIGGHTISCKNLWPHDVPDRWPHDFVFVRVSTLAYRSESQVQSIVCMAVLLDRGEQFVTKNRGSNVLDRDAQIFGYSAILTITPR